jgi:hypothetical protein
LMFISCSLDGNSMHSNCDPFERQDNTAEICTTCFFCGDGHISSRLLGRGGCTTWPGSGKTTDELEITCAALICTRYGTWYEPYCTVQHVGTFF